MTNAPSFGTDHAAAPETALLFLWHPELSGFDLAAIEATTRTGDSWQTNWSTGSRSRFIIGERIYLFRLGVNRGIVASGIVTSFPYNAPDWADSANVREYVDISLDSASLTPLSQSVLLSKIPSVRWDYQRTSGQRLEDEAAALEAIWNEHLQTLDLTPAQTVVSAQERGAIGAMTEGAVRTTTVVTYERNPAARAACIAHHGLACSACDMNFEDVYGSIGAGFIHVHHLREISTIGAQYEVDPIADLRPLCPNCHAMVHRRQPAMSIEALRQKIAQSGQD